MGCEANFKAYMAILGGLLIHLSLGTIYTIGNMIPYMVSYLRIHSQSTDLRNTGAIWLQSAALTGQALGMTISGPLQLKCSTRVTTVIGGVVMSSGVAVSYFTINQSFWLLLFTYGLMFGVGMGIAYTPAFACAMRLSGITVVAKIHTKDFQWLPEKKGLVTGLVQMGFGAGAFVFNQIQTVFINPDNFTPDLAISAQSRERYFTQPDVLDRVPTCFLLLAGCYTGLQIIGILLISDRPSDEQDVEVSVEITDSDSTTTTECSRKSSSWGQDNKSFVNESSCPANGERVGTTADGIQLKSLDEKQVSSRHPSYKYRNTESTFSSIENRPESNLPVCPSTGETLPLQKIPRKESYTKEASESDVIEQKQYSILEMIKTRNFWLLYFTMLLNGLGTILITSMYKAYGQTFIRDDHLLALVGSFSALFNSFGRPVWGYLADIFSYKVAMMFLCTCTCVLLFTFDMTQMGGKVMFFVWVCAFYFSFCGNYSMMPAVTSRTFGTTRVGINYSVVFTSQIITSFVGAILASQLKDAIGWFGLFQVTGVLIFLSLILTSIFNGRNPDGTPV